MTNLIHQDTEIHPLDKAAQLMGGRKVLAKGLEVSPAAVGNWKLRGVPIEQCTRIELMCGSLVGRRELRPHDWHLIWPELAGSSAAVQGG